MIQSVAYFLRFVLYWLLFSNSALSAFILLLLLGTEKQPLNCYSYGGAR